MDINTHTHSITQWVHIRYILFCDLLFVLSNKLLTVFLVNKLMTLWCFTIYLPQFNEFLIIVPLGYQQWWPIYNSDSVHVLIFNP